MWPSFPPGSVAVIRQQPHATARLKATAVVNSCVVGSILFPRPYAVHNAQGDFQLNAEACWAALAQHQRQQQGRSASGRGFQNNTFMDDEEDEEDCWLEVRHAIAQHAVFEQPACACPAC